MKTKLIVKPRGVLQRIGELELTPDCLMETIDTMVAAQRSETLNDVRGAGGSKAYYDGTRRFRDMTVGMEWKVTRDGQLKGIKHEGLNMRVIVCNADAGTGLIEIGPSNCNAKGPATEHAVELNGVAGPFLDFFREASNSVALNFPNPKEGPTTWYLFVYAGGLTYRAELSCPVHLSEAGYFMGFYERIILARDGDNDNTLRSRIIVPDGMADLEITVTRKRA